MGRPWLNADDFNVKLSEVTEKLDEQLKFDSYSSNGALIANNKTYSDKSLKLQNYLYSDVFMDNYGDPVFNLNNNLIGYKLSEKKCASVKTYYNDENLLCNEILIRELDLKFLSFINEPLDSWIDIKTEFGFIREYNNTKYFYDRHNIITNVEVKFSCSQFPLHKKKSRNKQ